MRLVGAVMAAAVAVFAGPVCAKTLVFCSEADPESLNPQVVTNVTGMNAAEPIFDGLVRFEPGGGAIRPGLAESWTISPDGLTYTFRLRRGVMYHSNRLFTPSREFNADDVLFSFGRQWRADNPYHNPKGGAFTYFQDLGWADLLEAIDRIDEHTVRFRLTRPEAPFLADLALPFAKMQSAEYAAALTRARVESLFDSEPIGTGAFVFDGYRRNVEVRFKAFPDHWSGKPDIDTLIFSITPNASVRLTKLKTGECQVMSFPSPEDADKIERDPGLVLLRQDGLNVGYMAMNVSRPPFDDVRVRKAVNLAVDKATLVQAVYGRMGRVAKNPLPPTVWSYNDAVPAYPYDPDAARRLMSDAGLPRGFDVDLWYLPLTRAYSPDSRRIAEIIADDLSRIGIRTRLMTAAWPEFHNTVLKGVPQLTLYGWTGDNADPDNFLGLLLGCNDGHPLANNVAKWCDPAYSALVQRARETGDQTARAALYMQAQVIAHDEAPWLPIAHGTVIGATRRNVKGFQLDPFGRYLFDQVTLDK